MKRLYRSKDNKMISGILGGMGDYFQIDPALLRLAYLFISITTGVVPGVIVYLVALFIIPFASPEQV